MNENGADKPTTFVVGNKKDLKGQREVDESAAKDWCSSKKCRYYEVSTKNNINVKETIMDMINVILKK